MISKFKALGLALTAVLALSAVAAQAAQAQEEGVFEYGAGTTQLTAEADPSDPSQLFTIEPTEGVVASFTCDEVNTPAISVSEESETTEIESGKITYNDAGTTPEEEVCTGKLGAFNVQAKVEMNGCTYNFKAGTTVGEAADGETEGTADLVCPAGKEIEVTAFGCNAKVPPQNGLGPVKYRTVKVNNIESVTIEAKVGDGGHGNAIHYTTSGFVCGEHTENNGTYTGKVLVTGSNDAGEQKPVTVT